MNNTKHVSENSFYYFDPPRKPIIRKLGTIACDVVESTPVVFHEKLYRLEYFRAKQHNAKNPEATTYFYFYDNETGAYTQPFAHNHHFGYAFTDGDIMYVCGIYVNKAIEDGWGGNNVRIFKSTDLVTWEVYSDIKLPDGTGAYNTGICLKDGVYTMLIETNKPLSFRFRFAQSSDMKNWTLLDEEHRFHKDRRYAGGPAIYTVSGDDHYYVFYLEACPGPMYVTNIARSINLIDWEYSPINPVLMFDEYEDKKIANPLLTKEERERIVRAWDINNSDLECCEFGGKTIINYSWGCQRGIEFLAEAVYDGGIKDFLQGFFEKK